MAVPEECATCAKAKRKIIFQQEIAPQGKSPTFGPPAILDLTVPFFFSLCLSSETSMLQYLLLCLLRGKTNRVIDP